MESFGAYLKNLREEKGKTLEEISESTKIAMANLVLLEQDSYDMLPPRVFVKGFVRAYVQELGLDPSEALAKFDAFMEETEPRAPQLEEDDEPLPPPSLVISPFRRWFTIILTAAGLISLIILVLTGISRLFLERKASRDDLPKVSAVEPPAQPRSGILSEPMAKPSASPVSNTSQRLPEKKILKIKAVATTWIWVQPDGDKPEERVMAPGDMVIFTAKSSFRLQIGNAGGIRIQFDGRDLPPLGKMNQTISLTLP